MLTDTLQVTAICDGTVIDHLRAGLALRILQLLKLQQERVTIGMNLKSASMGFKDLIKIEGVFLSKDQTAQIALFSPLATVNVIQECRVIQKYKVSLPKQIDSVISCPNRLCITNHEKIPTRFSIQATPQCAILRCYFCEKTHTHGAPHDRDP